MKQRRKSAINKSILALSIGFVFCLNGVCQYTPLPETSRERIIPMTPEASMFNKYGNTTVNKSKGVSEISIPLYDLVVDDVRIPILLSYASSGVQVTDINGIVGANWRLSAGGMIYRNIRGNADEKADGWFGCTSCQSVYNSLGAWYSSPSQYQTELQAYASNTTDPQPDLFGFSFGEYSGNFYFTRTGAIVTCDYVPFKIEMVDDTDSEGSFIYFVITDGKGNRYIFGDATSSREEDFLLCKNNGNTIAFKSGEGDTGWKLTRIITNKGNTVEFGYDQYSYRRTYLASHQFTQYGTESDYYEMPMDNIRNYLSFEEIFNEQNYHCSLLTSITAPNCLINLEYASIENTLGWKKVLSSISINDQEVRQIKKFLFDIHHESAGQLFLDKISELGGYGETALSDGYSFTYNAMGSLDRIGSMGRDFFGYANGAIENETLIARPTNIDFAFGGDRRINYDYIMQGTLLSINYPTGGHSDFEYEPNSIGNSYAGGLRIKRVVDYDENDLPYNDRYFSYKGLTGYVITQDLNSQTGFIIDYPAFLTGTDYVLYSDDPSLKYQDATDFYYRSVTETKYKNEVPEQRITDQYSATINGGSYRPYLTSQTMEGNNGLSINDTSWFKVKESNTYFSENNYISYPYYISIDSYLEESGEPVTYFPGLFPKSVRFANPLMEQKVETEYSGDNSPFVSGTAYTYNHHGLVIEVMTNFIPTGNQPGDVVQVEHIKYPEDYSGTLYPGMVSDNMLDFTIERIIETNGVVTNSRLTTYSYNYGCSTYLPDKVFTSNPGISYTSYPFYTGTENIGSHYNVSNPDVWYESYLCNGKPTVIKTKDGITTNYYWGYDSLYPVAQVQSGAPLSYDYELQKAIRNEEVETSDISDYLAFLINEFSEIIAEAPGKVLTLYTYLPLIGISSATDPNRNTTYYEYDSFGRLEYLRDNNRNILKYFKYNYAK